LLALGFAGCHRLGRLLVSSQQTPDYLYYLMSLLPWVPLHFKEAVGGKVRHA
jgi:hypothetical protein